MENREIHQRLVYGGENAVAEVYDRYCCVVHMVAVRVTRTPPQANEQMIS